MAEHIVCPWWIGYVLASPIRKLLQNPAGIIAPYIRDGMTVLEPGPGMGFFTLEIARRVGPSGYVIAVESQPQMIEPAGHVKEAEFREELEVAAVAGLKIVDRPSLKRCITALLQRE